MPAGTVIGRLRGVAKAARIPSSKNLPRQDSPSPLAALTNQNRHDEASTGIDLKILSELQKNGRIHQCRSGRTGEPLAEPCLMRVKKLQSEGYIANYSAQINLSKLGQALTVFTEVTLKNHRRPTSPASSRRSRRSIR